MTNQGDIQMKRVLLTAACAAVFAAGSIGCGGGETVEVNGRVGDDLGSQEQGLSVAPTSFGGEGTAEASTQVKAFIMTGAGELTLAAEADVRAGGEYTIDVPEGSEVVVLQAYDASGSITATTLVERTDLGLGEAISAAPMDSETSVEAQVYQWMRIGGAESANVVDVRARITKAIAAELQKQESDVESSSARLSALARGIQAAQEAQVKAYAKAGVQITQQELFEAQAEAGLALSASLAKGESAAAAYAAFFESIAAKLEEKGLDAKERAEAEREASASFRVMIQAELDADPLVELAVSSAASAEARASAAALEAILAAAEAGAEAKETATAAATTLKTEVAAAVTGAAAAQAFAKFSASIATGAELQGTVLGQTVGATATGELAIDTAVSATVTAGNTLETALETTLTTADGADPVAIATAVSEAYGTYQDAVRAQAMALAALGAGATPTVELLILAEGSFRLRQ